MKKQRPHEMGALGTNSQSRSYRSCAVGELAKDLSQVPECMAVARGALALDVQLVRVQNLQRLR